MQQEPPTPLADLPGFPFPVRISPGVEETARGIAARCARAHRFFRETLAADAAMTVRVLAPQDWPAHAAFPVYGMPHCVDRRTLAVAGEDNDFWQGFAPPADATPARLRAVYGRPDGSLDLSPFFDLLAVHEMGHVFHNQAGCRFPRLWLMELFCNLALHTYVAAQEPDQLPALETFPQTVVEQGHGGFAHHTLDDFERLYEKVGARNYGWYQCRLHVAAARIHDASGGAALARLWAAFLPAHDPFTDAALAERLRDAVHPEVAAVWETWPK